MNVTKPQKMVLSRSHEEGIRRKQRTMQPRKVPYHSHGYITRDCTTFLQIPRNLPEKTTKRNHKPGRRWQLETQIGRHTKPPLLQLLCAATNQASGSQQVGEPRRYPSMPNNYNAKCWPRTSHAIASSHERTVFTLAGRERILSRAKTPGRSLGSHMFRRAGRETAGFASTSSHDRKMKPSPKEVVGSCSIRQAEYSPTHDDSDQDTLPVLEFQRSLSYSKPSDRDRIKKKLSQKSMTPVNRRRRTHRNNKGIFFSDRSPKSIPTLDRVTQNLINEIIEESGVGIPVLM